MTLSPFSNLPQQSDSHPSLIAIDYELVRGSETQLVNELMHRVLAGSVSLDLSAVERIDAAGIAALITLYCSAIQAGHRFSVVAPSAHVRDLLRIVGLESILIAPPLVSLSFAADCHPGSSLEDCLNREPVLTAA